MNGWIDGFLPMWAPLVAMIQQGTAIFGVLPALSSLHNPIQGKWSITTVVFQLDAKVHVIVWETFDEIISRKNTMIRSPMKRACIAVRRCGSRIKIQAKGYTAYFVQQQEWHNPAMSENV
jgi:hypothetical protein